MKKIGHFNATRYWQKYAFAHPPEGYIYKRAIDIPFHLTPTKNQFLLNTKWVLPFQGFDLFHTYNSIVPFGYPFVVEVESRMPRYGHRKEGNKWYDWGIKRLQSNDCRGIIFTSEHTRKANQENFTKWGIDPDKCQVIYRAVETPGSLLTRDEKEFRILFVGNAFYRKGGPELLKAFKRLPYKEIKLTIVSSFEIDWAIFPSKEEKEWIAKTINEDPRISIFSYLSHEKVIELMRHSHLFVNTTFADPFNNTLLEALACGTPALASDTRANPEFVKDQFNGFTTPVDKMNKLKIIDFIEDKIKMLYQDKDLRHTMGQNAYEFVNKHFTIANRNEKLKKFFDKII